MNKILFLKLSFSFICFYSCGLSTLTIASKLSKRSAKELAKMETSVFGSENPYEEQGPNQEPLVRRIFLLEQRLSTLEALVKSWGDVAARIAPGPRRQSSSSRK